MVCGKLIAIYMEHSGALDDLKKREENDSTWREMNWLGGQIWPNIIFNILFFSIFYNYVLENIFKKSNDWELAIAIYNITRSLSSCKPNRTDHNESRLNIKILNRKPNACGRARTWVHPGTDLGI